jgi:hypothetical protein
MRKLFEGLMPSPDYICTVELTEVIAIVGRVI